MILLIYNLKPTGLHYAIALFIISIKQAKEFVYNIRSKATNNKLSQKRNLLKCSKDIICFVIYSKMQIAN